MDAPLAVLLSALLVCSCSLPTKRGLNEGHAGAFGSDGAIARAAVVGLASSEDLARPEGTDASSEKWLDSYRKRSAPDMIWRWDGGRVPYVIDNTIPQEAIPNILLAMEHWHNHTCIRFYPATNDTIYIRILLNNIYCNSMIGKVPYLVYVAGYSGQPVQLTPSCANVTGNIIHELGHVVGLYHEQCRPDRDQYVSVLTNNIIQSLRPDFAIIPSIDTSYGPYDLGSIMHYSLNANSRNGLNTMALKVAYSGVVGQRDGLSSGDIQKISRMYGCPSVTQSTSITPSASLTTPSASLTTPSMTTSSLGATSSRPIATPIATPTVPSGSAPTVATNASAGFDPNSILSGSNIALKIYVSANFFWIGCTAASCAVTNCPGNRFKPEKVTLCPEYIFVISRTDGGSIVRVGDPVSLTQLGGSALYCGTNNLACMMSSSCRDPYGQFSTQLCSNQVMVIKALNKGTGQPVMNGDNIVLDFRVSSLRVSGYVDTLHCHNQSGGTCERSYCFDTTATDPAGNTTLSTMSNCRQLFTLFKLS